METCPHCHFLVPDGARVCTVCRKSLTSSDGGTPAFLSGERHHPHAVAAHVGPGEAGMPVSVIALFAVALLLALALLASSQLWM